MNVNVQDPLWPISVTFLKVSGNLLPAFACCDAHGSGYSGLYIPSYTNAPISISSIVIWPICNAWSLTILPSSTIVCLGVLLVLFIIKSYDLLCSSSCSNVIIVGLFFVLVISFLKYELSMFYQIFF